MEPESALRAWALADGTVSGLIGARFYPMKLPQVPTLPACTYSRVSYVRPDEIPFPTTRIQVTCWAESHGEARALAVALESAASRRKGTVSGLRIIYANVENTIDLYDPDTGYYKAPVDFKVTYREA